MEGIDLCCGYNGVCFTVALGIPCLCGNASNRQRAFLLFDLVAILSVHVLRKLSEVLRVERDSTYRGFHLSLESSGGELVHSKGAALNDLINFREVTISKQVTHISPLNCRSMTAKSRKSIPYSRAANVRSLYHRR